MPALQSYRKPGSQTSPYAASAGRLILDKLSILWRSRSTPSRLRAAQFLAISGAVLLGWAAWYAYSELRAAVQTVGKDTVPSVLAALHIRANLAEANADAANAFLLKENRDGPNWTAFRRQMDEVHGEIMTAAGNITYGDEEAVPIRTIMTSLPAYEQLLGMGRGALAAGVTDPAALSRASASMLQADQMMHATILPACTALAKANTSHLDSVYHSYQSRSLATVLPAAFFALYLLASLGYTQWDLFVTMRRMVNRGLAAATLAVIVLSAMGISTFLSARSDLRIAKEDAFDSLNALWEARSIGKDANGDESLYLLLHGNPIEQKKRTTDFREKADRLMPRDTQQALALVQAGHRVEGFLGAELANVTFPGEKEAAMDTLVHWAEYYTIDSKIRALEQQGKTSEALALNVGTQEGQSNWAFDRFDSSLGVTLEINKKEFDAAVARAFDTLGAFPYLLALAVLIIGGASFAGIKPRLDEYRF